jgi:hypothetical protein
VRGRTFTWYLEDHHGDGRVALHCRVASGEQQALVAEDAKRFFVPPYLGARGWVGLWLDLPEVGWDEVAELVTESYRLIAPKGLARQV